MGSTGGVLSLVHVFEYDLVYARVQNSSMRMGEIGIDDFSVF